MTTLHLAKGLDLPLDVATEAGAVIARRGRGKTYAASVFAEELHAAGQPFVVLDPTGAWFGLRSSADGASPGLPVTIIGGDHGDLPLSEGSGKVLATFVVDHPGAYVLDLSGLDTNAAQDRFVTDFAERLYRAKGSDRTPLNLIVDEADSFAPQKPFPGQQRMLGAFEAIVRRGRVRGLGCVLITQRPAVLNKNVMTQAGWLLLLGITGPQDRTAVDEWIKGHASAEQRQAVLGALAGLGVGEAFMWWPTEDVFERIQVRKRRTFDSSATPKAGQAVQSVAFADVDLDQLKDAIADAVAKAEATDPKVLQGRIKQLERDLADALKDRPTPEPEVVRVEVPVITEDDLAKVAKVIDLAPLLEGANSALLELAERIGAVRRDRQDVPRTRPAGGGADQVGHGSVNRTAADRRQKALDAAQRADPPQRREPSGAAVPRSEATEGLTEYSQVLLAGLARRHPLPVSKSQLATLSGRSHRSSMFSPSLAALVQAGYAEKDGSGYMATTAGLEVVGSVAVVPQTAGARLAMWLQRLPEYEAVLLQVIVDAWPDALSREQVSEASGRSLTSSMFKPSLTNLVRLELVTIDRDGCYTASDDLVQD